MGVGGSIFLIAVGALLAFAVDYQLWWLDIAVAGWVLMVVGALGLVLTVVLWSRRRSPDYVEHHDHHSHEDPRADEDRPARRPPGTQRYGPPQ